jgi:hypothetical protein
MDHAVVVHIDELDLKRNIITKQKNITIAGVLGQEEQLNFCHIVKDGILKV